MRSTIQRPLRRDRWVIVALPNFGDEVGVVQTLELAKSNVPVLVQGRDDDPGKLERLSRRATHLHR